MSNLDARPRCCIAGGGPAGMMLGLLPFGYGLRRGHVRVAEAGSDTLD